MTDWSRLDAALSKRPPSLWWRDDDAVADTPALHRLMDLTDSVGAPLTLAVIPGNLSDTLAPVIAGRNVTTAVHGWTHTNHAPKGEKSAEFGAHRVQTAALDEAARGKAILDGTFGAQSLPLFIPPWNRVAPDLPLADLGYTGISVFGERHIIQENGLTRFDAHIDPINWRGNRSAVAVQKVIDQISLLLVEDAPIGLMTHHLAHDEAIWQLVETVVTRLTRAGAVWLHASELKPDR